MIETLRRYAVGHAVLAVSHRPAVIAAADVVVDLDAAARPPPDRHRIACPRRRSDVNCPSPTSTGADA